jgi:hypothetical protein
MPPKKGRVFQVSSSDEEDADMVQQSELTRGCGFFVFVLVFLKK